MPFTATLYPASATGWTNSSSVCAVDGAEASASSAGPSSPTPSLVCSAFGLTGGGFAAITDLTVTVKARMTLEGAMYVGLANNGAPIGAVKSAFVTFGEDTGSGFVGIEYTFNGWGFPISDYDLRNLSVFIYCASNPALPNTTPGQCYIEYVSAIAEYPAGDATPNAFSFGAAVGVPFNTEQTSATITLAGLSDAASVSVSNGLYEKNASGVWTATQGSAVNGDTFRVKHTSAGTGLTPKTTTLLIGGVSAGFTSTTEAADTTPDAFSLTAQTPILCGSKLDGSKASTANGGMRLTTPGPACKTCVWKTGLPCALRRSKRSLIILRYLPHIQRFATWTCKSQSTLTGKRVDRLREGLPATPKRSADSLKSR